MKNSLIAALGVAMVASLGSVSAANATVNINIDLSIGGGDGKPSYIGSNLAGASIFDLGPTTKWAVQKAGAGDQSGLSYQSPLKVSSGPITLSAFAATDIVVKWGAFTDTFTRVISVTNGSGGFVTTLFGELTGPGITNPQVSTFILAATQNKVGSTISESASIYSGTGGGGVLPPVPEISTWMMMILGFSAIGFGRSRHRSRYLAV